MAKMAKEPKPPQAFCCWLCKEKTTDYVLYNSKRYHPHCVEKKKQLEIDQVEWEELYRYVFSDIFGYKQGMKMPPYIIMRLKGLRDGKFHGNKNIQKCADYSFKTILLTFKAKKVDILSMYDRMTFKDESHRMNAVMKVIENHINEIAMRLNRNVETNNKLSSLEICDLQISEESSTPTKTEHSTEKQQNKMAEKFKNLW